MIFFMKETKRYKKINTHRKGDKGTHKKWDPTTPKHQNSESINKGP